MTPHFIPDAPKPITEGDILRKIDASLMARRRAVMGQIRTLQTELADIEQILGLQKKTVDKR